MRASANHPIAPRGQLWRELVACGSNATKRKLAIKNFSKEIFILLREFNFDLPEYYLALARCMLTLEGLALRADSHFDIFRAALPCAIRALPQSADSRGWRESRWNRGPNKGSRHIEETQAKSAPYEAGRGYGA